MALIFTVYFFHSMIKALFILFISHYLTKEPLFKDLIQKIQINKNAFSGYFIQSQCYLSFLTLNLFSGGTNKDSSNIMRELSSHFMPNYESSNSGFFHLSFGHLTEYGPTYYGYLWSKVFAADIFEEIKKEWLLNPNIGRR